jgi:excisionase family DNA binding protein
MSRERYIQPKVAARTLQCALPSFYRLIREGRIPGVVRLGPKSIRIDRLQFERWLAAGGAGAGAGPASKPMPWTYGPAVLGACVGKAGERAGRPKRGRVLKRVESNQARV